MIHDVSSLKFCEVVCETANEVSGDWSPAESRSSSPGLAALATAFSAQKPLGF